MSQIIVVKFIFITNSGKIKMGRICLRAEGGASYGHAPLVEAVILSGAFPGSFEVHCEEKLCSCGVEINRQGNPHV